MKTKALVWAIGVALLWAWGCAAAAPEVARSTVRHPNLLLNQPEIEQIKQKIRDHGWAAQLLERVKAKAAKDDALPETAIAYALTGETPAALSVP